MRLHRIVPRTRAEGPGMRFTIWVQGCRNACPGCYSTALWDTAGGHEADADQIITQIRQTPDIEGITFLGGEPMEQAASLARIAAAARTSGLSVLTFTGLLYEDILQEADPDKLELLAYTDLLIDGPYLQAQHDTSRPWVGSKNQRYLFLTDRYSMADIEKCRNRVEFRLDKNGILRLNGMGDFAALEQILSDKTMIRGNEDGIHHI